MRSIAVINQKGGVGKTTTVANLGVALARMGQRVLLVDLDPQAHLSLHLGVEPSQVNLTVYQVLTEMLPIEQARLAVSDTLHLVPSHIDLAAAEMELASAVGRDLILRDQLAQLQGQYDILLMDCPPSLGLLTINALAAATEVFIPLQPHFLALQGLSKLLKTVSLVTQRLNPALRVSGILLCMYETNTRLAAEVVDNIRTFLEAGRGKPLPWSKAVFFRTRIRRNIKLAESPSHGESIFEYGPKTAGALDYSKLAREVLGLNEPEPEPEPEPATEPVNEPPLEPGQALAATPESAVPAAAPAPAGDNGDVRATDGQNSASPPREPVPDA